jgi:hypothetical protein
MFVPVRVFRAGKSRVVSVADGKLITVSSTVRRPYRAVPSRLRISTPFILHLHGGENLAYQFFPDRTTPDGEMRIRVCFHESGNTNTPGSNHLFVKIRDLTLPDGECFGEFCREGTERRLEEKYGIIPFGLFLLDMPAKADEGPLSGTKPPDHLMIAQYLCPFAALIAPVKEPAFCLSVKSGEFFIISKQGTISPEQGGMRSAPLIHQFPEHSITDCLPDPVDLGKGDPQVMHGKESFPVR